MTKIIISPDTLARLRRASIGEFICDPPPVPTGDGMMAIEIDEDMAANIRGMGAATDEEAVQLLLDRWEE